MATEYTKKMRGLLQELLDTIGQQERALKEQKEYISSLQRERNDLRTKLNTLTQHTNGSGHVDAATFRNKTLSLDFSAPIPEMDETDGRGDSVIETMADSKPDPIAESNGSGKVFDFISHSEGTESPKRGVPTSPTGPPERRFSGGEGRRPSDSYPPIPPKPKLCSGNNSPTVSSKNSSPSNSLSSPKSPTSPTPSKGSSSSATSPQPFLFGRGKSNTIKRDGKEFIEAAGLSRNERCSTMSSGQAFQEHHRKKRKHKSIDDNTRPAGNRRRSSTTTPGMDTAGNKFDYQFSPDIEQRLQLKIEQGIAMTYKRSIEECNRAALVIQRHYRRRKIRQRFKTLRKEVASVSLLQARPRAASLKTPMRGHSMRFRSTGGGGSAKVSILDEFPDIKKLTGRLHSKKQVMKHHPLVTSVAHDTGPSPQLMQQESLEIQETKLDFVDKSTTPVRINLSPVEISEDALLEEVPSPDVLFTPSPPDSTASENDSSLKLPSSVPMSLSVDDFLGPSSGFTDDARPHSVSIMTHASRSRSLEDLMMINSEPGQPTQPRLKPQESATSLKRKTNIGITLFNREPAKGILYLVLQGILKDSPHDVAHFVRNQYGLSKAMIGKFFSDMKNEFSMGVLEALAESMNFAGRPIDDALRNFQEIFQITGEAQVIEKIVYTFSGKYYASNLTGVVDSEDAAFILSYAIMMLNTDLHSPQVRHHITINEWIKMNKGNNSGEDFPPEFLQQIYTRIQKDSFKPGLDHLAKLEYIQKTISGADCPAVVLPHRQFRFEIMVNEVSEKTFSTHHSRMLFIFNDIMLVCKCNNTKKLQHTFPYRSSLPLLNVVAIQCDSLRKYKHGVQLLSAVDGKKLFTCSCDSTVSQTQLMKKLSESIHETSELENMRIATLSQRHKSSARRPSIVKNRSTSKKIHGPITSPMEEHELSSDTMVISRTNTLVKCGSSPAIPELSDSDSFSITDTVVIGSLPSPSTTVATSNLQVNGTPAPPNNNQLPGNPLRPNVSQQRSKKITRMSSVGNNSGERSSSPSKGSTGILRRLKGKSSFSVNT